MKIGQVVKKYNIPVNSLYFYINNGLLVPPRRNNQYVFDENTLSELECILQMKQMCFPLKTIHRVLSLRRISNFYSEDDRNLRNTLYLQHREHLIDESINLANALKKVDAQLEAWNIPELPKTKTGLPLKMLGLICCPNCGSTLSMEQVSMNQQYIFHAALHCTCGFSALVEDGILQTQNKNTSLYDKPDTTRELYKDLPSETLSMYEKSYRWLESRISDQVSPGKVWLESYVNAWFFFHNHLNLLNEQDSLIVIDKFPETLLAYKEVIEAQGTPCSILYIADDSPTPPLIKECIDCNMDFFAVNEHNFYHDDLYLTQLLPYLKKNALLYGVYFCFENGRKSMEELLSSYPEASYHNFNAKWFLEETKKYFRVRETYYCGSSTSSGNNLGLGFHVPGETLRLMAYSATPE